MKIIRRKVFNSDDKNSFGFNRAKRMLEKGEDLLGIMFMLDTKNGHISAHVGSSDRIKDRKALGDLIEDFTEALLDLVDLD